MNEVKLNLERLKIFRAVYDHKSIQNAARLESVTPSAASQAIKKLEEELGAVLFERRNKEMSPTSSAAELNEIIAPCFGRLRQLESRLSSRVEDLRGEIRLGAPIQFGQTRVVNLLSDFRKKHSNVTFDLTLGMPDLLFEKLKQNKLDLVLADAASNYANLFPCIVLKSIYEEQSIIGSNNYFQSRHGKVPGWREALKNGLFITHLEKDADIKFWFRHHFGVIPRNFEVVLRVPNILAVREAVLQGMGMGMMSLRLVEEDLRAGRIQCLAGKRKAYQNEMAIVLPITKQENLLAKRFADFLVQHLN